MWNINILNIKPSNVFTAKLTQFFFFKSISRPTCASYQWLILDSIHNINLLLSSAFPSLPFPTTAPSQPPHATPLPLLITILRPSLLPSWSASGTRPKGENKDVNADRRRWNSCTNKSFSKCTYGAWWFPQALGSNDSRTLLLPSESSGTAVKISTLKHFLLQVVWPAAGRMKCAGPHEAQLG